MPKGIKGSSKDSVGNAEGQIVLSPEQLQEMIEKAVEKRIGTISKGNDTDISSVLKKLTEQISSKNVDEKQTIKEYEIDVNDYLDTELFYFSYSFSYGIYGDVRFGRQIETPYNRPIKFKPLYRYKKPDGGKHSDKMITTSICKIRSKKEKEFLENHSLFGIKFFKTQGEVIDLDTAYADKLVEISYVLNAMSEHEVITRAKQEKISIDTMNVDEIKRRLVYHLADKEMKSIKPKVGMPKPISNDWTPDELEKALDKQTY